MGFSVDTIMECEEICGKTCTRNDDCDHFCDFATAQFGFCKYCPYVDEECAQLNLSYYGERACESICIPESNISNDF